MQSIRRARGVSYPKTMTIIFGVPKESISQYSRFIMMMMLNHDKHMLNKGLAIPVAALEFE